jgi:hypothetical protein
MPGRRETLTRDRQRNSVARKRTNRKVLAEQQQQSELLRGLEQKARAAAK